MPLICGVDPGLDGALAFIEPAMTRNNRVEEF
jgi:hypothetical protein